MFVLVIVNTLIFTIIIYRTSNNKAYDAHSFVPVVKKKSILTELKSAVFERKIQRHSNEYLIKCGFSRTFIVFRFLLNLLICMAVKVAD